MSASACGKIILTGEYAVVFGYAGIAMPAPFHVSTTFKGDTSLNDIEIQWNSGLETQASDLWNNYIQDIINLCISLGSVPPGTITIENTIPLNKGMGSSTAFVIAIAKCLLGEDCEEQAAMIEDTVNPGHSGIDFAVIWNAAPIIFKKDETPELIDLSSNILEGALLIDTGKPEQQTSELVTWVQKRKTALTEPLKTIGQCSKKLQQGGDISAIFKEHNTAQQLLGVVSDKAKSLIKRIEQEGGAAKVIGAGGRTGGSGMVLAMNIDASKIPPEYPVIPLHT